MAAEYELIGPDDKPALIAFSNPEYLEFVRATLLQLGYKVHAAQNAEDFISRFSQVSYELVIIEETFGGATLAENAALSWLQRLPMARRRHATTALVGMSFQTMHAMQAFQQSVHAVIHPQDFVNFAGIVQKVVSDNTLFLNTYRDVLKQMVSGKT